MLVPLCTQIGDPISSLNKHDDDSYIIPFCRFLVICLLHIIPQTRKSRVGVADKFCKQNNTHMGYNSNDK